MFWSSPEDGGITGKKTPSLRFYFKHRPALVVKLECFGLENLWPILNVGHQVQDSLSFFVGIRNQVVLGVLGGSLVIIPSSSLARNVRMNSNFF